MKLTRLICLLAVTSLIVSCKKEIKADKAFIEEVAKYYAGQTSLTADVDYKIKYFDNDDTTKVKANVKLIRDTKDTIYGGIVWYKANVDTIYKGYEKYYDGSKIYIVENDSTRITRFDAKKGQTFAIDGATDGDVKNIYFFKPEKLTEILTDTTVQNIITDTVFNDKDYALLTMKFPDEGDFKGSVKKVYINKENKLIEKITYYSKYADQFQYDEWNISNVEFNNVKKEELDKHLGEFTAKYKLTDYKEPTKEEMAPLAVGTTAPEFTAKLYKDNKEVKLSDYKGKVVLLDFWYMSCYPCALAVPHLSKIQEKYRDKVVVLGLNPYDTDEKEIAKLPAFIERTGLKYAIATIDRKVVTQYNVHGFPTLYVIDKNGVIQYAQTGFGEETEQILEKAIKGIK